MLMFVARQRPRMECDQGLAVVDARPATSVGRRHGRQWVRRDVPACRRRDDFLFMIVRRRTIGVDVGQTTTGVRLPQLQRDWRSIDTDNNMLNVAAWLC